MGSSDGAFFLAHNKGRQTSAWISVAYPLFCRPSLTCCMIESRNGFMSLPTAFAMCPMAMNASRNAVRIGVLGREIRHTERTLVRFAEKSKEVAHRLVEEVFAEGLCIVYSKGRNKGNDHFPH
jgi:hypothetical protein